MDGHISHGRESPIPRDAGDLAAPQKKGPPQQSYDLHTWYTSVNASDVPQPPNDFSYNSIKTPWHPATSPARVWSSRLFSRSHILLNWRLELTACVGLIAAFVALCVTLSVYADKPSPDWPSWLSLNTIVAIYMTLFKTCLLLVAAEGLGQLKWLWVAGDRARPCADLVSFDNASRGPFGALSLLWRLKVSHVLSSLGAIITVLTLAVDPFAQQIVHYYQCSVPSSARPSIPRTNFYMYQEFMGDNPDADVLTPAVQDAANAGLYSPATSPNINCTTGNCAWAEEYSSLGWCSQCYDISDQLSFKNTTLPYNKTSTGYPQYNVTTSLKDVGVEMSTASDDLVKLQDADYATMSYGNDSSQPQPPMGSWNYFILGRQPGEPVNPMTGSPFAFCNTTTSNQTDWQCKGYGASKCYSVPCVRTYTATVQTGSFIETLTDVRTDWGLEMSDDNTTATLAMVDTHCINSDDRQSLIELGYKINNRWLPYNCSASFFQLQRGAPQDDTFPQSMVNKNCVYALDGAFVLHLLVTLESIFSGTIEGLAVVPGQLLGQFFGPQGMMKLFNYGDVGLNWVNDTYSNVSLSLTNYLRQNGPASHTDPALGIEMQQKSCIRIQWPWLSFPGTLVVLTLYFFITLVARTRPTSSSPQVWKSSLLPFLYSGPPQEDVSALLPDDVFAAGYDLEGMTARAASTRVRLDQSTPNKIRLEA